MLKSVAVQARVPHHAWVPNAEMPHRYNRADRKRPASVGQRPDSLINRYPERRAAGAHFLRHATFDQKRCFILPASDQEVVRLSINRD
jgi:hypothetical protein